jgi:putative colanic acid biosynthesis acetyltransferase WcaF
MRRLLWSVIWGIGGLYGPRRLSGWRVFLLRRFGARIGRGVLISGGVKVLMPWNLEIADFVAVAEGVTFYNFALVRIGAQTTLSQGAFLCTGSHDYMAPHFPLIWKPIEVGTEVWIAMKCILLPGTIVGDGCVVGAGSVVSGNLPAWYVYAGNPCRPLKPRVLKGSFNN